MNISAGDDQVLEVASGEVIRLFPSETSRNLLRVIGDGIVRLMVLQLK
jgi:hypothetical protein